MADEQINMDYDKAHRKAFLRSMASAFRRQPNDLLAYGEVQRLNKAEAETYQGIKSVPVKDIVGSVDRYQDFDRAFFPRQRHTASRWKNIDRAYHRDVRLPPVQLYKVDDVYFVKDGNHRVSVGRQHGVEFIDAEVIERRVRAPINSTMTAPQILRQLEYAEFLRQTDLDRSRPQHDIRPSGLGRFDVMLAAIRERAVQLTAQRGTPVSLSEAAEVWFDTDYMPIVTSAREAKLLREFPLHSEADVYLWALRNRDRFGTAVFGDTDASIASAFAESEGKRDRLKRLAVRLQRSVR